MELIESAIGGRFVASWFLFSAEFLTSFAKNAARQRISHQFMIIQGGPVRLSFILVGLPPLIIREKEGQLYCGILRGPSCLILIGGKKVQASSVDGKCCRLQSV